MTAEAQAKLLFQLRRQGHALHERALTAEVHVANGGVLDAYAAERMVAHAREALAHATALHRAATNQPEPVQG